MACSMSRRKCALLIDVVIQNSKLQDITLVYIILSPDCLTVSLDSESNVYADYIISEGEKA